MFVCNQSAYIVPISTNSALDDVQVFVAGATGRLGCRVVLELLRNKKLRVRAGARNPQEGRALVKAATDYGILTAEQARRLTVVPVDLEDEDSIAPAVGNAGRVSLVDNWPTRNSTVLCLISLPQLWGMLAE